jgi:hypothetical protein
LPQQREVDDSLDLHILARGLFDQPKLGLDRALYQPIVFGGRRYKRYQGLT